MEWQPMETAPKGETIKKRIFKDKVREVHVPEKVLAPTSDGEITMTYWIPEQERWNMFSKKVPPTHWMPLPKPPVLDGDEQ